jgi:type I restriction enzyme S subunit
VINEAWPLRPLGELFEIGAGKTMSAAGRNGQDKTPFLRTSNVLWDTIDLTTVDQMAIPEHELPAKLLRPGDLLVCEGGEIGRAAIWSGEAELMSFQNHLHRLRPLGDDVDSRFYVYLLQSAFTQLGIFEGAANKTTIPNLSRNRLATLDVPHPRLDEQQAVASTLARVRAAVQLHDRSSELAEELKRAAMRELFARGLRDEAQKGTEIGLVPESWEIVPFSEACFIAQGQVDPKIEPYASMLHIGPENVEQNTGRLLPCALVKELGLISGKYLFNETDIVYSKIRPNLRKAALPDFVGVCSADMYPLTPRSGFSRYFLFFYLLSETFTAHATAHQIRTGIPKINREQLNSIRIPKPPVDEQEDIARIIEAIDRKADLHRKKRAVLDELFKALLHKLMTGQIRVADLDLSALAAPGSAEGLPAGSKGHGNEIAHALSRVGNVPLTISDSRQ